MPTLESEEQYERAGELCVSLAERFDKLSQGEKDYLSVLSDLLGKYEERWDEEKPVTPRELIVFLMEQNNLNQNDLIPLFGSSSRVSEYLSGKRELSLQQIQKLSQRFKLSPAAFIRA